jgi:tetratricopeptide (TPR) repeat protein
VRRLIIVLPLLLPAIAHAQPVAEKRAAIAKMLDALRTAPDAEVAALLEQRIIHDWVQAGTPAVTLLMSKGLRALKGKQPADAAAAFSDAILLDPTLAEAWYERALARYLNGDLPGAVHDLEETLKLEPRHFEAWRTLEQLAAEREDWKAAYEAWSHVMDIDPRTPNGDERLKDLKRKAFGDNT